MGMHYKKNMDKQMTGVGNETPLTRKKKNMD